MKFHLLYFIIFIGLLGCNSPDEVPVFDSIKPADKFARQFIDQVIKGNQDSALRLVDESKVNDETKEFLSNTILQINYAKPKSYKVVESRFNTTVSTNSPKFTIYNLAYDYTFDRGNILFTITVKEIDKKLSVIEFNSNFLIAPLSEVTEFKLKGKATFNYIFLILSILVAIFTISTFILMLFTKMSIKKKLLWSLLILMFSLPKFILNWETGEFDFKLFHFSLFGSGFSKANLYSFWIISTSIPIGAILFLVKRKKLANQNQHEIVE